jgi:diguanylate cyclase (GGDEF)-like protein
MTDTVPPGAAARLLAATADAVLLVEDGRVVRSWPDDDVADLPLTGLPLAQIVHPDDDLPFPPPRRTIARLRLRGDEHRWFEVTSAGDPGGGCWLAARDVHERVERERDLERRLARPLQGVDVEQQQLLARAYEETASARAALQAALDATTDSFAVYGLERDESGAVARIVVRLANAAAAEPLGFSPEDLVGHDLLEVFPELQSCGLWEAIVDSADSGEGRRHRVHIQDDDGVWQASFDNTIAPVGEDEVVVTWRDVTRDEQGRRHLEQTRSQAEHAATHDHLTGLPNRALLEQRLREALDAPGEGLVGVVFCDLDEFKAVNDTYGHHAGDLVLSAVAQRLHLLTRHGETAARLAGDEFVLLLRDLPPGWHPEEFLRRADRCVRRPVDVGPAVVTPSASLGVVLVDPRIDDRSPKALLDEADRAMYQVKRQRSAMQISGATHP